jgi:hypothetical protein
VTTLRLAQELGANQSVKMLLQHVFRVNRPEYQEALMLDLPRLLDDDMKERLYPFLERDHEELVALEEEAD